MEMKSSFAMEMAFWRLFRKFFAQAERSRRWSIEKDIPWDQVNLSHNDLLIGIVSHFMIVEGFLPDYMAKIMQLIRKQSDPGRMYLHINWTYEESKHMLAFLDWITRIGYQTEEQTVYLIHESHGAGEWNLPVETPRQMMIYTMIQERATSMAYVNLRELARNHNDPALEKILTWLIGDENAHHRLFFDGVQIFLEYDREGTLRDIAEVFSNFRMPGPGIVPEFRKRALIAARNGIYTQDQYHNQVVLPIYKNLKLTRNELQIAGAPAEAVAVDEQDPPRTTITTSYGGVTHAHADIDTLQILTKG